MWKKHFFHYSLQAFRTAEKLKFHIKDCFKINGKQKIQMPKEGEYFKFKFLKENKITIYDIYDTDFDSILVPKDNGKENPDESYTTNKFRKHGGCSYAYKLICVDDKFSKRFKSYCSELVKNILTKNL